MPSIQCGFNLYDIFLKRHSKTLICHGHKIIYFFNSYEHITAPNVLIQTDLTFLTVLTFRLPFLSTVNEIIRNDLSSISVHTHA